MTVFDIAALVVVAACLITGWKSGFIKTAVSLISFAVALVLAFVLAQPVATAVYERYWPDAVVLEQQPDSSSQLTQEQQQAGGLIGALTDENAADQSIGEIIDRYNTEHGTDYDLSGVMSVLGISQDDSVPLFVYQLSDNVEALLSGAGGLLAQNGAEENFAQAFTRNLQRYLTVTLLTFGVFIAILIVVRLLMKLLGSLLSGIVSKIPVLSGFNRLLGAILGAILGAALAFVFFVVLRQVAMFSTDADFVQLVSSSGGYELADRLSRMFLTAKAG